MDTIPIVASNHYPLILIVKPKVGDDGRFKYETALEDHEDCMEVVRWVRKRKLRLRGIERMY